MKITATRLNACHLFFAVIVLLAFAGQVPANSNATDGDITTNVITLNTNNDDVNPSPDFDGDGTVGLPDFLLFVDQFGFSRDDEEYEARFDLDGDGIIGIGDFLIFVNNFGKKVSSSSPAVTIPDANLRAAIEAALSKASGTPITKYEMKTLTRLTAGAGVEGSAEIRDLTGLEFATNLTNLWLWFNDIPDISVLAGLTNLTTLYLGDSNITDISVLAGLTNLTTLYLSGNNITDISALAGLTNLTTLDLVRNNITDISALVGLTNLTTLDLLDNNIRDISPLAANTGLGSGDVVDVGHNLLDATSINTHIPELQARGVSISFDAILRFTDPQIYNDNVFVLPVSENLVAGNLPLEDYATRFYEYFSDEFDFLMFVANLPQGRAEVPYGAFYRGVKNDVQGIGVRSFFSDRWGSAGKLQGMIYFAAYATYDDSTYGVRHSIFTEGTPLHELMHRWANFVVPTSLGGHWGFSSADGSLGGFDIAKLVNHGGGRYTAGNFAVFTRRYKVGPYSPIELYLAGFIPRKEVPDLWVAEDGEWLRDEGGRSIRADNGYPIFTASRIKTYTIDDIIAEHGPRVPDASQAQKDFRAAVILLISEDYPAIRHILERLSGDVSWLSHTGEDEVEQFNFYEATGGRATIKMDGLSQVQRRVGTKKAVPPSFGTPPPPILDHWEIGNTREDIDRTSRPIPAKVEQP